MAGIQLSGLASGFDWKSTVTQLMAIERVPQDNLRRQQAAALKVQSAFDTLKTNLNALKTAASALSTSFTGTPRSVSVSSGDGGATSASDATASTASGAALGTYAIEVTSLPKSSSLTGVAAKLYPSVTNGKSLTLGDFGVTEGTVTIAGTQYTISAADLSRKINADANSVFDTTDSDKLKLKKTGETSTSAVTGVTMTYPSGKGLELATASMNMGSPGDTSNFLSALGLVYGSSKYEQTISQSVLASLTLGKLDNGALSPSGTLVVNGVSVGTFTSGSTLGDVVSKINSASGAGVTATIDPATGSLRLTANATGQYPIVVTESGGNIGQVLGLVGGAVPAVVPGSGIQFKLDGTPYTSPTAEIDLSRYGYGNTKIAPISTGKFSVKVTSNALENRGKINTLISAYNSLKTMVDDSTRVTKGTDGKVSASVFSNRSDINTLLSGIRSRVYTEVSGVSSSYNTMGKIGIGFDKNGVMSVVDSAKLDAALADNPSAVGALFNTSDSTAKTDLSKQGVATRLVDLMTALTGTGGLVATATAALTTQNKRFQTQIEAMDRSLAKQQASLEASFIAMERAQSRFNSMSSQISSAFSSNK